MEGGKEVWSDYIFQCALLDFEGCRQYQESRRSRRSHWGRGSSPGLCLTPWPGSLHCEGNLKLFTRQLIIYHLFETLHFEKVLSVKTVQTSNRNFNISARETESQIFQMMKLKIQFVIYNFHNFDE